MDFCYELVFTSAPCRINRNYKSYVLSINSHTSVTVCVCAGSMLTSYYIINHQIKTHDSEL